MNGDCNFLKSKLLPSLKVRTLRFQSDTFRSSSTLYFWLFLQIYPSDFWGPGSQMILTIWDAPLLFEIVMQAYYKYIYSIYIYIIK